MTEETYASMKPYVRDVIEFERNYEDRVAEWRGSTLSENRIDNSNGGEI